jgi:hypothetical protein
MMKLKMLKNLGNVCGILSLSLLGTLTFTHSASALDFTIDATGADALDDPDFWGMRITGGTVTQFIESVTINLRGGTDTDAFFDFNDDRPGGAGSGPEVDTTSLNGIASDKITFSPNTGNPSALTIAFATNSFGIGDSFRFGADIDRLAADGDTDRGGSLGFKEVTVSATLKSGQVLNGVFIQQDDPNQSIATLSSGSAAVPFEFSPALGILLSAGLLGTHQLRKLKQNSSVKL